MKKENEGITLIALVITIIVMLILVGVTITMAVNGGLFEKAGEAASKTNNAVEAEQALSNGAITVGGVYYNSIGEYMKEIQKEVKLIEFKIEDFTGTTFYAKEGMTWGEWVKSAYNTVGAIIDEDGACSEYTPIKIDLNGNSGWLNYKNTPPTPYQGRNNVDFNDVIIKSEEIEYYLAGLE